MIIKHIIIYVVVPALIAIVLQGQDRKHVDPCDKCIQDNYHGYGEGI